MDAEVGRTGSVDRDGDAVLRIAEMAALTGVGEATLRVWEARHGAPKPIRTANGHRRYSQRDVELVAAVVELRRAGLAVPAALRRAAIGMAPKPGSVYAAVREARPELQSQALGKPALVRISHALEDESLAQARPGLMIGGFQRESFYRAAEARWRNLAAGMKLTLVFAEFAGPAPPGDRRLIEIPLAGASPLGREWILIGTAGCMVARERTPGREGGRRTFDVIWSPEPEVVHEAARTAVALIADDALARRALAVLGPAPRPSSPELRRAAALTNRIVGYLGLTTGLQGS